MLSRHLWETSGHWDHYKENMYTTVIDEEDFAIKPMNCPGGILVYESEPRSYRDLPLRMGELGIVHRHEKSGQLHGLMRVRCFTQDDAHIFMMPEQIRDEIKGVANLINERLQPVRLQIPCGAVHPPGGQHGKRRGLGDGHRRACGTPWTTWDCPMWSTKETALSTAPRSTSIWKIPLEEPGSAVPSSWISSCRCGLTWNTPARTARSTAHHDSPGGLRFHRTFHRHSDRAFRGSLPHLAGAGAGEGAADLRKAYGLR